MLVCDFCGQAKECFNPQIEGREYDICPDCWNPIAEKLKGKGRLAKKREIVLLPATPAPEPPDPKPSPERPPKIWANTPVAVRLF